MDDKKLVLDEIDRGIIQELQVNGRESYKSIARKLGVSDGTVRLRTERMIRLGYLRISASVNPLFFENTLTCMVCLTLTQRCDRKLMRQIAALPGVQNVMNVTGRYDLIVEVSVSSRKALRSFLVDALSDLGAVTASESFMYLEGINKWVEHRE
ncbi:Lrp/AsnC family transcriptional regulator [Desulfocurvus sp. DL9XJH121]